MNLEENSLSLSEFLVSLCNATKNSLVDALNTQFSQTISLKVLFTGKNLCNWRKFKGQIYNFSNNLSFQDIEFLQEQKD